MRNSIKNTSGKRPKKGGGSLGNALMSIDIFGESIGFTVGDGHRQSRSLVTTLLTLMLYAVLLAYGLQKHNELRLYEDTSFFSSESRNPNIFNGVPFDETGVKISFQVLQMFPN